MTGVKNLLLLCLYFLGSALVTAGFKLPSHVYRADELEKAVQKAEDGDKALAFVLTDEAST